MSPRESATDEELRAAEYLAGRFSGWGYEVGLQDFEAVEISSGATRLVVTWAGGCGGGSVAVSGTGTATGVWMFAFPVDPSSLAADGYEAGGANGVRGSGHGRGFLGGRRERAEIALIEGGGGVSLREKVEGAGEAGAEAAVIFNEEANAGASWARVFRDTRIPGHRDREPGGAGVVAGLGNGGQPGGEGLQIAVGATAVPERRSRAEQRHRRRRDAGNRGAL